MRSIALGLREKQPVKVDDYVLEHMLLYHGLVGSSPDNQRDFRDVRADINEAIREHSSVQLAIFLKLAPLWWEDKLISIFEELSEAQRVQAIDLFMPEDQAGTLPPDANPIKHPDWRVRSNTAKLLAFLKAEKAIEPLGKLLSDTTGNANLSYSHIAYALGKFDTANSVLALSRHKQADEAWLRVDIAGALSLCTFERVAKILSGMLVRESEMKDYMSVAIAKNIKPSLFLDSTDPEVREGGLELVIGLVDAAQNSFAKTTVMDYGLDLKLSELTESAIQSQSLRAIYCALKLQNWAMSCREEVPVPDLAWLAAYQTFTSLPTMDQLKDLHESLCTERTRQSIVAKLKALDGSARGDSDEVRSIERYAIRLAGELKIGDALDPLLHMLDQNSVFRDDLINSLGQIAKADAAPALIALAKILVDIETRNATPKSKQPVLEEDLDGSRSFWHILKALGQIPNEQSAEFLQLCLDDFAPDKRSQALDSLVDVIRQKPALLEEKKLDQILANGLQDSSSMTKLAALKGVSRLNRASLVADVVKLIDMNENAVSKVAFSTLADLASNGAHKAVSDALKDKLKGEKESFKRKRIEEFITGTLKS